MKKLIMLLILAVVMLTTSSCNLLRGAGQDIENAGDAVNDAVN